MVAAGLADEVLVQVAYAIGVSKPLGLFINTFGTSKVSLSDSEVALKIQEIFDLRPNAIIRRFGLKNPIFQPTASYGHMGRDHFTRKEVFYPNVNGDETVEREVEFFTWEKVDYIDKLKKAFGL
jgi:S-adenosylmethionine synthetase